MTRIARWVSLALLCSSCGAPAQEVIATTAAPTSNTKSTTSTSTSTSTTATTTTTLPTTTTTTLLEGNWAHEPLIATDFERALGWWDGSQWVEPKPETTLPIEGGEDYQTVVLGSVGRTVGGPQIEACDFSGPPLFPGVELQGGELKVSETEELGWSPHGIAVSAPWDMTPHQITSPGADDPAHEATAAQLLAEQGLEVESPRIRQVIDTDLNGDGAMESLVVVDKNDPPVISEEGYYSLVFHVDSRDGAATLVEKSVDPPGDTADFPTSYRVGAIADLNGDGVMEVILSHLQIESLGAGVYEWVRGEERFAHHLEAGCGA